MTVEAIVRPGADTSALEALTGTGIACRTADDTWALRTLTGSADISVTNGDGVAGNPTLDLTAAVLAALVPIGTILPTAGYQADTNYLLCDGSAISRTTYPTLLSKISFGCTGDRTSGSALISNLSAGVTSILRTGGGTIKVEGAGIPAGATVSLVNSGTQITLSANATSSGTGGTLRFFFYGNGDGSTTFNIPNLQQRFPLGKAGSLATGAGLGETGGNMDHTHTSAPHTHTVPGHWHSHDTSVGSNYLPGSGIPKFVGGTGTYEVVNGSPGNYRDATIADGTGGIGNRNSGVDGNAAMTSGSTTPGATGSNNPPYLTLNFQIKAL